MFDCKVSALETLANGTQFLQHEPEKEKSPTIDEGGGVLVGSNMGGGGCTT